MDYVAILGEVADQRVDLPQSQRCLQTALQIAAHEAILKNTQFQSRRAGSIASCAAILLDQLEHALDGHCRRYLPENRLREGRRLVRDKDWKDSSPKPT